jgi:hypothetical protein
MIRDRSSIDAVLPESFLQRACHDEVSSQAPLAEVAGAFSSGKAEVV